MVLTLAGLLRQLRQGIAVVEQQIEELTAAHKDFALFEGHHSATPLGQFLRRMKARLGAAAGITATANKIARIFYAIVSQQVEYDETIWRQQDAQRERREENKLKRRARQLGYELVPIHAG